MLERATPKARWAIRAPADRSSALPTFGETTYGFRGVGYYAHNAIVPQPTCGAGLSPQAAVSGVSASVIIGANNPGNNTGSWQADINAATWEVRIMGSDGSQAGTNARALVTTFCALA